MLHKCGTNRSTGPSLCLVLFLIAASLVTRAQVAKPAVAPEETLQTQASALNALATFWTALEESWRGAAYDSLLTQSDLFPDSAGTVLHAVRNGHAIVRRTYNLSAAMRIKTSPLWPDSSSNLNLSGANDWGELAIWDMNFPLSYHQELSGRLRKPLSEELEPHYTGSHATHCAGTMIASGVEHEAHGMSPAGFLDAYNWDNDASEMASAAASGLLASNHSYGTSCGWSGPIYGVSNFGDIGDTAVYRWDGDTSVSRVEDYKFGFYDVEAAQRDTLAYLAPYYTMVQAAGNERHEPSNVPAWPYIPAWGDPAVDPWFLTRIPNCPGSGCPQADAASNGYDTLCPQATAKNVITVGSVYPADPMVSAFSSCGPTDDGRIKPDIVAQGDEVYSSWANEQEWNPAFYYNVLSGTSMACASVTGSVNILAQLYKSRHNGAPPRAATMKALIVHTAKAVGGGYAPDYRCGWGVMNTEAAAELICDDALRPWRIQEGTLASGQRHDFFVYSDGSRPIVASMAWTDPPGASPSPIVDPAAPALVNDLDVRITYMGNKTAYYPFVLNPALPDEAATTGDNVLDNVEKIAVAQPAPGYYLVSISHKSVLAAPQPYSLVMDGGDYPGVTTYDNKSAETELDYDGTPYSSASMDYDEDGRNDLLISMQANYSMMFRCINLSADQVPVFAPATEDAFPAVSDRPQAGLRGIAIADYNNDGHLDVFAAHATAPRLYRHEVGHTFTDQASATGILANAQSSWTGAWSDYNRDGWLDLLVGRWAYAGQDPSPIAEGSGLEYNLLGNCVGATGSFVLKNSVAGLAGGPTAACVAATWGDFNGDNLQDFFVGDLKGSGRLYVNIGRNDLAGEFQFEDQTASLMPWSESAVSGCVWVDYDGDGDLDLALSRMAEVGQCLDIQRNDGGSFTHMYWPILGVASLLPTSGLMSLDFDMNGRMDLLVLPASDSGHPDLYANNDPGGVVTFVNMWDQSGLQLGRADGAVIADFNDDGDQDLYVGRPEATKKYFYRARSAVSGAEGLGRHSVRIKLVGNRHDNSVAGTGALVRVESTDAAGEPIVLTQVVDGGSGRGTQAQPVLSFGTGSLSRSLKMTVRWPNGRVQESSPLVSTTSATLYTTTEPTGAPTINDQSVVATYIGLPNEQAQWTFQWRTEDWSNPALDRVVVCDLTNQPPSCHIGTVELRDSLYGVAVTVEKTADGKYLHTLTWDETDCVGACMYSYHVFSTNNGVETSSAAKRLTIGVCLQ